jgi:hypothetical protein
VDIHGSLSITSAVTVETAKCGDSSRRKECKQWRTDSAVVPVPTS